MPSALRLYGLRSHQRQPKKERYRSEYLMKFCWKRRGCSCLVTYGKYLGLAGFLGRWAVLVCGITILETVLFFYNLLLLLLGNNRGVGLSRFSLGELIAAPQCANRTGESGLFFCFFVSFFETCYNSSPLGDTACGSVLFGSSFRCSDEHASPLCYWIFPLSQSEKKRQMFDYYIVCFSIFCFYFAKHIGVGLGGRESYIWTMRSGFAGRVFQRDSSRAFSIHIWSRPFSVLLQIFMGNSGGVGTADRRYPGNFIWRMCVV
jgi:hypothetical protein